MLTYNQAYDLHKERFYRGIGGTSNYVYNFPYGINYIHDIFIIKEIPTSLLNAVVIYPELVDKYKDILLKEEMDPIWITFGKTTNSGRILQHWDKLLHIQDGNHRTAAIQSLNREYITAILPLPHYNEYLINNINI